MLSSSTAATFKTQIVESNAYIPTKDTLRSSLPSKMPATATPEPLVVSCSKPSTTRFCHEVHAVAWIDGRARHLTSRQEPLSDDWQELVCHTPPATDAMGESLCSVALLPNDSLAACHHQIDHGSMQTSSLPSLKAAELSRQSSGTSLPTLSLVDETHSNILSASLPVVRTLDQESFESASLPRTVVRKAAARVAAAESGMEISVVEAATEAALAATEVGAGEEAARIAAEEAAAAAIGAAAVKAVLSRVTKAAERAAKAKGTSGHGSQHHPRLVHPDRPRWTSGTAMNHHNGGGPTPMHSGRSDKVHASQSRHESRTRRTPGARALSRPSSVRVGGV